MNNTQNNGVTISLLLIVMMISSMMSSSVTLMGFNLFTAIRPSKEVTRQIKTQENRVDALAKQAGVDGEKFRKDMNEEIRKACLVTINSEGKCPEGMKPGSGQCCDFLDPKMPSTTDMFKEMAPDMVIAILGGVLAETALIVAVRLGIQVSTGAGRAALMAGAANIARTAWTHGIRAALTQMGTRFAVAAACSPPCLAVTVALAVFTVAIDMTDPFGYNNFTANEVIRRKRNAIDVALEESLVKNGNTVPILFPLEAAYPDLGKDLQEKLIIEFLPDALELMPQEVMVEFLISQLSDTPLKGSEAERVELEMANALERAFLNTKKRDEIVYEYYVSKGKKSEIEKVPSMSSKNVIGVTLNEEGAKKYNERMKAKHLLYSNPHRSPPAEIPKDYSPFVAAYTDTYRVLNKESPGEKHNPNVVEKKLNVKTCLCFPYGSLIADCEYGFAATKHSQRLNPAVYGVTFNYERGECNFTHDYCKRLGLKLKNNDCKLREGQKEAELILGKTITRAYVEDWDNRIDAFKSGDPVNIMYGVASLNPVSVALNPWLNKASAAIKDTYGRGVGTPMVCGENKERKGALCYPRCRTGPNGEKLYKSSALECEGVCPDGSKNTGLTCLKPIKSYIPSNKCSNPFKKCFYQRKPCKDGYVYRGTTCNEPCPGFTFRSGALGTAFCDKPRNRYSRAGKAKVPDQCPKGKVKDAALCYKPCKPGYRGNGPTCKKTEESRQKNQYDVSGRMKDSKPKF